MTIVDTTVGIIVGLSTSPPSSTSSIHDSSSSSSSASSVANDQDQSTDHNHSHPPPPAPNTLHDHRRSNSTSADVGENAEAALDNDRSTMKLQELFSKLNPMAKEFVPPSLSNDHNANVNANANNNHSLTTALATLHDYDSTFYPENGNNDNNPVLVSDVNNNGHLDGTVPKKKNFGLAKRRMNTRTSMAQREEIIRRTVYVSDIDQQVTEEQLAALFVGCGQVVDCRICGDPNSVLRFAFIEFTDDDGARAALNLSGTMLGYCPLRVLPSKTAIAPVNPTFLPRNDDEREMCTRTIYCTNIDKKVTQSDVKHFFESVCGEVYRLRLLGDYHHSTRIAFVEFVQAESAIAALNCSGVLLGALPIRVSPSKTPVRPRSPRPPTPLPLPAQ